MVAVSGVLLGASAARNTIQGADRLHEGNGGADPLLRGFSRAFAINYKNCTISDKWEGKTRYTTPALRDWSDVLHANGKLLIHHACGHLKDIVPAMCRAGVDMIESISPPPTGNIDIGEAAALMPDHVGLIGGIEPTFFKNCTLDELEARVYHLLDTMKGKRFVLANSDSCPPGVDYEKFRLVSEIVRRTV